MIAAAGHLLQVLRVAEKDMRKKQQKKEGKKKGRFGLGWGTQDEPTRADAVACFSLRSVHFKAYLSAPCRAAAKREAKMTYRPPQPGERVYKGHRR
jgi:hypothetical protein